MSIRVDSVVFEGFFDGHFHDFGVIVSGREIGRLPSKVNHISPLKEDKRVSLQKVGLFFVRFKGDSFCVKMPKFDLISIETHFLLSRTIKNCHISFVMSA